MSFSNMVQGEKGLLVLLRCLSGGCRFWSEEAALRVEDAALEIQDIISTLET